MPRKSKSDYPPNWKEIALKVKKTAGWRCVRCDHPHDVISGHVLTVHHLDLDPANCRWWNIPPLCQRCHPTIQAKVIMERTWMFEHTDWFKPYVAGYYAHRFNHPDDREYVERFTDALIALGQSGFAPPSYRHM